jgi:hypothetical protein
MAPNREFFCAIREKGKREKGKAEKLQVNGRAYILTFSPMIR